MKKVGYFVVCVSMVGFVLSAAVVFASMPFMVFIESCQDAMKDCTAEKVFMKGFMAMLFFGGFGMLVLLVADCIQCLSGRRT